MRLLKFFVILGGIALLAGYALLFQRYFDQPKAAPAPVAVAVTALELPVGSRVTALSPHGEGTALLIDGNAGQELILLDKKGNQLKRLPVKSAPVTP